MRFTSVELGNFCQCSAILQAYLVILFAMRCRARCSVSPTEGGLTSLPDESQTWLA